MSLDAVANAARAAYHDYLEGFYSHDPANVTPHVTSPLTVVASSGSKILSRPRDIEAWFQETLNRLLAVNYERTVLDFEDVTVLDEGMALIRVAGSRLDGSGAVLERVAAAYTMVKQTDGTWRIAVMMPFTAPGREEHSA